MNLKKYAKYFLSKGRIGRQTFWIGVGIRTACYSVALLLVLVASVPLPHGVVAITLFYVILAPFALNTVAMDAQRLHDRNKPSIWILFFLLVPVIGSLWRLVELGCLKGTTGDNRYGKDPFK